MGYYPFGMLMPARRYQATAAYRYGFNGQEKEIELSENLTSAEFWMYDSRLGRRWNVDPATRKHPEESPYLAFHNNPLFFSDPLGDDPPDGFVKRYGQGGDLYIPENAEIFYQKNQEFDPKGAFEYNPVIEGFKFGNATFTAKYDDNEKFLGYFSGDTKYENPDVTMTQGTFRGEDKSGMNASFSVKNVPCTGLEAVQVISASAYLPVSDNLGLPLDADRFITGQYQYTDSRTRVAGEVDGGINSFFYYTEGHVVDITGPYYLGDDNEWKTTYDESTNSRTIDVEDFVTARVAHKQIKITTFIVAKNYMNSGQDLILATFRWGWKGTGQVPLHTANISLAGDSATPTEMAIINHYYPAYKFFDVKTK